jgi:hypothetical protein
MRLAMRRLDYHRIERLRVLTMSVKEGSIVKTHSAATNHQRVKSRLDDSGPACVPDLAKRFAAKPAIAQELDRTFNGQWRKSSRIKGPTNGHFHRLANAGRECFLNRRRVDHGNQSAASVSSFKECSQDRVAIP